MAASFVYIRIKPNYTRADWGKKEGKQEGYSAGSRHCFYPKESPRDRTFGEAESMDMCFPKESYRDARG